MGAPAFMRGKERLQRSGKEFATSILRFSAGNAFLPPFEEPSRKLILPVGLRFSGLLQRRRRTDSSCCGCESVKPARGRLPRRAGDGTARVSVWERG